MLTRIICAIFGHPWSMALNDSHIMVRPSSAVGFYTLSYCMRCKQLYFKYTDAKYDPTKLPTDSGLHAYQGEMEIVQLGAKNVTVTHNNAAVQPSVMHDSAFD